MEAYASASSIARRYRALGGRRADTAADRAWQDAVEALSLGLATTTLLLDPALIVLGGGLSRAGAALLDPVRHALAARLAWRSAPPVVLSRLGTAAGWIGAAALCYRRLGRDDALAAWTVEVLLDRAEEP